MNGFFTWSEIPLREVFRLQTVLKNSMTTADFSYDSDPETNADLDTGVNPVAGAEWKPERLAPRVEEMRLWEIVRELDLVPFRKVAAERGSSVALQVGCISTGRAQAAEWLARTNVDSHVTVWYLDQFQAYRALEHVALPDPNLPESVGLPANLDIACVADLPEKEYHLALLPMVVSGEVELARDCLQQMYHRLAVGGRLVVSVDNAEDKWVHDQLKGFEKSVKVRKFPDAMVYMIDKSAPLKKVQDFSCELAFRDCDELIRFITRPGVFSHRQLDNGARQLLDAVDVYPGAKLLEIGCGSGSVTLGMAKRDPSAHVHAVDSNARSLDCVRRGIALNDLSNVTLELNHTGVYGEPGQYDMCLANPPYFGDFRIAEKFLIAAHRSLRKGGRLVLVTKQPRWYQENLERWFVECEVFPSRRYHIASGVKPQS
jgi:16S rRNA (guanine1207-N2)-methyltransferase